MHISDPSHPGQGAGDRTGQPGQDNAGASGRPGPSSDAAGRPGPSATADTTPGQPDQTSPHRTHPQPGQTAGQPAPSSPSDPGPGAYQAPQAGPYQPYAGSAYQAPQGSPYTSSTPFPPTCPGASGPYGTDLPGPAAGFFNSVRRAGLVRVEDRWVGGVAAGVARRLGVDPVLVRCVWVVVTLLSGLGPLLYGLAWAFLPEERDGRIHAQQVLDGDVSAGLAGSIAMTLLGLGTLDSGVGLSAVWAGTALGALTLSLLWPALVVTLIVVTAILVVRSIRARHGRRRTSPPSAGSPAPWPPAPGAPSPASPAAQAAPWPPSAQASATPGSTPSPSGPSPMAGPAPTSMYDQVSHAGTQAAASASTRQATGPQPYPAYPTQASPTQPTQPYLTNPAAPYPAAPRPPRPRKRRAPGPGRRMNLTVLALGLLGLAVLAVLVSTGALPYTAAVVIAIGLPTALLGAGVLISGLRGRRATWMTALGWPVAMVCIPALAAASFLPAGTITSPATSGSGLEISDRYTRTITVTDQMLREASSDGADGTVDLGTFSAGSLVIDLTGLSKPSQDVRVTTSLGGGRVTVRTKEGLPVSVHAEGGLAGVSARTATRWQPSGWMSEYSVPAGIESGPWGRQFALDGSERETWRIDDSLTPGATSENLTSAAATADSGSGHVVYVDASVGIGEISVIESSVETTWQGWKIQDRWIVSSWSDAEGYHGDLSTDWPVPGMRHPAVTEDQAQQCLSAATQWATDELMRRENEADREGGDGPDSGPGSEPWEWAERHEDDLYASLDTLTGLSSRSQAAFVACLDHVLAGGSAGSFAAPSGSEETGGDDAAASPAPSASPTASPTSADSPATSPTPTEAAPTSVPTTSAAGRGTEGH